MLLQLSQFPPFTPLRPAHPLPHTFPPFSSCPWSYILVLWVLHFLYNSYPPPVYFLPTTYASYSLYLFPHSPPSLSPLITLHMISISGFRSYFSCLLNLLLFLFFRFSYWLLFVVILLFIGFDLLFLRQVPLTFHIITPVGDDELLYLDLIWEALYLPLNSEW